MTECSENERAREERGGARQKDICEKARAHVCCHERLIVGLLHT